MMKNITVTDAESVRLDRYLRRVFVGATQGVIEKALRSKLVLLNNQKAKSNDRVTNGDIISYNVKAFNIEQQTDNNSNTFSQNIIALAHKIENDFLIYECKQFIAINKPYGVAVQGGSKITLSIDHALNYLNTKSANSYKLVHRLDKDTSGILLVAKGYENAATLTKAFKDRLLEKYYLAVLCGKPKNNTGLIENRIGKVKSGINEIVEVHDQGDLAITNYNIIKSAKNLSLVEYRPETGRTHQLRVHSKFLGCPILGDKKYNGLNHYRLMLHAYKLNIPKIIFNEEINLVAGCNFYNLF